MALRRPEADFISRFDPGKDRPANALDANQARQGCWREFLRLRRHPIIEPLICQAPLGRLDAFSPRDRG